MKRANVYFWDGYRFGCRIETADTDLEQRIKDALLWSKLHSRQLPGQVTAFFAAMAMAESIPISIEPPAPGRTTSQYVSAAESREHWPTMDYNGRTGVLQAGVFIVNTLTAEVRITGGIGFDPTVTDCNPAQLREMVLELPVEVEA